MLILSRKATEEIVIDGGIRLTIVGIRGNRVKVGITAPSHIIVQRPERTRGRARAGTPARLALATDMATPESRSSPTL